MDICSCSSTACITNTAWFVQCQDSEENDRLDVTILPWNHTSNPVAEAYTTGK